MKNKSLLLKLGLMVIAVGGFGLSFVSAANPGLTLFHLNLDSEKMRASTAKDITDQMMYVHFADNDNDFGGFLYFSNGSGDDEIEARYQIGTNSSTSHAYNCRKKIKGFYYNAERGERLWPLDDETWSNVLESKGVQTSGGIYASCVGTGYEAALQECDGLGPDSYTECVFNAKENHRALGFGYYGSVSQTYSGKIFNLTVGVAYKDNGPNSFISIDPDSGLVPSFEWLNNMITVGFVYDYNGGVGLAGCRFKDPDKNSMRKLIGEYNSLGSLSSIFEYNSGELKYKGHEFGDEDIKCEPMSMADTLLRIIIEGIVGMNEGGNEGNTKFGSLGNTSDTKMQYFGTKSVDSSTLMNYAIKKAELLCRGKWTDSHITTNDDTILCFNSGGFTGDLAKLNGKTLVVKQGDVTIKPFTGRNDDRNFDIYLLNGNLIIDESEVVDEAGKFVFNKGGFISNTTVDEFSGNVYNALCPGGECVGSYDGDDVAVGSFIRGNFIVNGEVKGASVNGELKNKYFIYGKFTTKEDTFNSLERKFSWTCENGFGSDNNYCPRFDGNPYRNAALIVIDQNYGSPLLR